MFHVVVLCFVGLVAAQNQRGNIDPNDIQILRYESDIDVLGGYKYAFEQSDGTRREEQAELKNAGTDNEAISVTGSYSWVGPDGIKYTVKYIADENGYQPTLEQDGPGSIPPGVAASLLG